MKHLWWTFAATSLLVACSLDTSVFLEDGELPGSGGAPVGTTVGVGGDTSTSGEVASVGPTTTSSSSTSAGGTMTTSTSTGMGGAPTTTSSTSTTMATTVTTTGVTTTATTTGVTTSVSTSAVTTTTTGGPPTCAHDLCYPGVALDPMCDPCVAAVCQNDPFCCSTQGSWDQLCTAQVTDTCPMTSCPCDDQYDAAPGHVSCGSPDDSTCDFNMSTQTQTCAQICAQGGGECVGVVNDGQGVCDKTQQDLGCFNSGFMSVICTCTVGCGNGPACPSNQICVNGTCQ